MPHATRQNQMRVDMPRFIRSFLLISVVSASLALTTAGAPSALAQTGDVEAHFRVVARAVEDGRIEFGVQYRLLTEPWSDRHLPRARFFPNDATVGRWLVSTPITAEFPWWQIGLFDLSGVADPIALLTGLTAEVRIVARLGADGRTEFGMQQNTDGDWGDVLSPRARFFPVDATVGQWLVSTPLSMPLTGVMERAKR